MQVPSVLQRIPEPMSEPEFLNTKSCPSFSSSSAYPKISVAEPEHFDAVLDPNPNPASTIRKLWITIN